MIFLRARVVDDHLVPRRGREEDYFFDKNSKNETNNAGIEADKGISWSSFYRLKWGVGQERE